MAPFYSGIPIDPGGETDNRSVKLSTKERTWINNMMRPEWSAEDLLQALRECSKQHPNAIVRSVSATYNCVGMVFATRRTWIDPVEIETILREDGYHQLPDLFENAEIGDIVLYKKSEELTHIGIIVIKNEDLKTAKRTFKILSKWGVWPEVIHSPDDVLSEYGKPVEVWTDRRTL